MKQLTIYQNITHLGYCQCSIKLTLSQESMCLNNSYILILSSYKYTILFREKEQYFNFGSCSCNWNFLISISGAYLIKKEQIFQFRELLPELKLWHFNFGSIFHKKEQMFQFREQNNKKQEHEISISGAFSYLFSYLFIIYLEHPFTWFFVL